MLQGFQQLTGINFIVYYGTSFFKSAGVANAFVITIIISVVGTTMVLVGIQLIDRVGRRRLLLIGATGMCICEFIIAIIGVTAGKTNDPTHINIAAQRVLIAFVCFYIAFFAISWGPVAWVVTGEIFPLSIRAKGMSLSTASNWLWNFAIGYATPYLVDPSTTGPAGVKTAHLAVKVFFIWCVPDIHMHVGLNKLISLLLIPGLPHVSPALSSPTSSSPKQKALPSNKLISSTANQAL